MRERRTLLRIRGSAEICDLERDTMAKILIADDESTVRRMIRQILEGAGHDVMEATNGAEAVRQVEKTQPDLLIVDVMMPQINGKEVCRKIRSSPETETLPIILMTAPWTTSDDFLALENTGADRFLAKPFDDAALMKAVQELLNQPPEK